MLDRRRFFGLAAGVSVAVATTPSKSSAAPSSIQGMTSAIDYGVTPGSSEDQSLAFSRMLEAASQLDQPLFLPPGGYVISNIKLPRVVRLAGVPGASRIVFGGGGHLFLSGETELVDLSGIVIDGAQRTLGGQASGLVDVRGVAQATIDNCQFLGSSKNALSLERCLGRVTRNTISGAADTAIFALDSAGLDISSNVISDCGNGGILVHRSAPADDRTLVTGNRIQRIAARDGGTGQNGNGINAFRANGVVISSNVISDCAFSAIRGNSSSNIQMIGNSCTNSGETAIYSEFSFEGAVVSSNIVDGAANGISIVNLDSGGRLGTCTGNIVRNLRRDGPYENTDPGFGTGIGVEADTVVSGNVVENAPLFGINLGWGPFQRNVIATGNIVRKARTGIGVSVVEGAGSALITDNLIEGSTAGAIVGHRWAKPVTGDLTSEPSAFPNVTVERNRSS